jgi:outer membrane protein, multidrug efflux system
MAIIRVSREAIGLGAVRKGIVVRNHQKSRAVGLLLCCLTTACAVEPVPLTPEARAERAVTDLNQIKAMEYVPNGPITLHQAMARAVTFNLQRRVKEIEREIEDAELRTSSFDMLPSLDLDSARNRDDQQLSSSDDRITNTASAGFTWNILDLGVSYARAKQQSNEVLIARENERKALQDIIRQVRTAYWRAAGAERLMRGVQASARHIKIAMRESRAMERSGANDVIKSVAYRREIVESVRQALSIQREMREARTELAELLNIRPGTPFELATTTLASTMPSLPMSLVEMEKHALDNRPELRVEDYNERISEWQAREAMFDMLPGAKLSASSNYSSDGFNLSPNWISTGFQLGMNIFNLFSGAGRIKEADKRGELARRQRLAVTLAVMTQTHMAYIQFRNASQQMRLSREVARADRRLALLVASDSDFVNTDYFEAVRIATRQLQSETDEHQAQVALISAHSEMMHAIGLDVFPDQARFGDVEALAAGIQRITAKWETGKEIELPSETPLDLLVNAMLQGGEAAPALGGKPAQPRKQRRKKAPMFEVRADDPEESLSDLPQSFSAIVTASGGPSRQLAVLSPNDDLHEGEGEPGLRDGGDGESSPEQEALIASQQEKQKFVVQLAVFRSESKARRFRRSVTEPEEAALHGVDVRVAERPTRKGETLHYVETAAVADWATARDLCATLKTFGQNCIPATR